MTQKIFYYWIKDLDAKFWCQNQKVLMLLDNASLHINSNKNESNVSILKKYLL